MRPLILAAALLSAAAFAFDNPAQAADGGAYARQNADAVCGFLPYRPAGDGRFDEPRRQPEAAAKIGPQTTYPFAWDLARPGFLAAEVAEDLIAGNSAEAVRGVHGSALSLGEYMLFAANKFAARPAAPASDDVRVVLAAERPQTFHAIYVQSNAAYEAAVEALDAPTTDAAALQRTADSWRPAYALVAKAQADDKRIELLATDLSADEVAEKEAVVCLAHGVALLAAGAPAADAKAAAARWAERPELNVRKLNRDLRASAFDYEDAGDDLAAMIAALPDGALDLAAMRTVAKAYATYVAMAKTLYETGKRLAQ